LQLPTDLHFDQVSLHELSISLSKGCKLSSNVNDELCSICQDEGDHFAVMDIHGLFT
jgi:hypothetical protein